MNNNLKSFGLLVATAGLMLGASPAIADIIEAEVSGEADVEYQDNVLRLPDGTSPGEGRSRSDTITTLSVGADAGVKISLQRLFLTGTVGRKTYAENSLLDSTFADVQSGINWRYGSRCDGIAAATYSRQQTDLGELLAIASNTTTTRGFEGSAGCRIAGYYRPEVSVFTRETENSLASQTASDVDTRGGSVSLSYAREPLSAAGVSLDYANRSYPNRVATTGVRLGDSDQYTLSVFAKRRITGKTTAEGSIGVSKLTGAADSGLLPTLEAALVWQATPKLAATFSTVRAVDVSDIVLSSYKVEQSELLDVSFAVTPFIDLAANVQYSDFTYEDAISTGGDREDSVLKLGAGATYALNRIISLKADYGYSTQSSNIARGNYDAQRFLVGIRATY